MLRRHNNSKQSVCLNLPASRAVGNEKAETVTQRWEAFEVLLHEPWSFPPGFAPCQIKIEINIRHPRLARVIVFILIRNTGRKKIKIETFSLSSAEKENNDSAMDGWRQPGPAGTMLSLSRATNDGY